MDLPPLLSELDAAVQFIRRAGAAAPRVGLVLGSGWGAVAGRVENPVTLPYGAIPHFPHTAVLGHAGQLVLGTLRGVPVAVMQGRVHYYEGHSMADVAFPVRVLCRLGIHTVVLTNAAGGIHPAFRAGDIMVLRDHLNLMGDSPLRGPNLDELGTRFPDLSEPYALDSIDAILKTARELDLHLHQGVYAALSGPTFETPAEVRMLGRLGADAVGMSTVPECIAANHMGVRVAGLSCIANPAAGISPHKLTHQEVMDVARSSEPRLCALLEHIVPALDNLHEI